MDDYKDKIIEVYWGYKDKQSFFETYNRFSDYCKRKISLFNDNFSLLLENYNNNSAYVMDADPPKFYELFGFNSNDDFKHSEIQNDFFLNMRLPLIELKYMAFCKEFHDKKIDLKRKEIDRLEKKLYGKGENNTPIRVVSVKSGNGIGKNQQFKAYINKPWNNNQEEE